MGVFSAVAGNQLPNQLQKKVLPALFHLRCPSQSHQRSARGRTRLTTVTSISCRSFQRQLLYLLQYTPAQRAGIQKHLVPGMKYERVLVRTLCTWYLGKHICKHISLMIFFSLFRTCFQFTLRVPYPFFLPNISSTPSVLPDSSSQRYKCCGHSEKEKNQTSLESRQVNQVLAYRIREHNETTPDK